MNTILFQYTLHLADNALILGQRNSEWTGHGPVLEQDIAITNISLDLLGQARNFYQYAATLYNNFTQEEKAETDFITPRLWKTFDRDINEDDLSFLRDERQYLNLLLTELPKGDWAYTVLRQFFFSAFQFYLYEALKKSTDPQLVAIAEKSSKEVTYHLRWSSEWVIRLGDGTDESTDRLKRALEDLWPYTGELFTPTIYEQQATEKGYAPELQSLQKDWQQKVTDILQEATLVIPTSSWAQSGGKEGKHTEHMGYLLAEMQHLQRSYPNATW